jgi:hypothetical protein
MPANIAAIRGRPTATPTPLRPPPMTLVHFTGPASILFAPARPAAIDFARGTAVTVVVAAASAAKPEAKRGAHHRASSGSDRESGGSGGGGGQSPPLPLAPTGPTFLFAGASGAGGGVLFALWCAILVEAVAWAAQARRRHRVRLFLIAQTGFVSVQQRPG